MGGGSVVRAAGRAVGGLGSGVSGGVQEVLSAASGGAGCAAGHGRPRRVVSLSASRPSSSSPPSAALVTGRGGRQHTAGEEETEAVSGHQFAERFVFGPVPSKEEVVEAISTMQQMLFPFAFPQDPWDQFSSSMEKDVRDTGIITDTMQSLPSSESRSDWIKPNTQPYSGDRLQARKKVMDAFRLLQINPLVQKTIVSLSSDKAVWDAVMNNDAVKELRESICAAEIRSPSADDGHDIPPGILKWIIKKIKSKLMELVDKISKILDDLLLPPSKNKVDQMNHFEDALRSSFMLCIMVFFVVIITRFSNA